jgi:hypothetical protein
MATPQAREAARMACAVRADARAIALAPIIAEIRASGITTPYAIAADVTRRGIPAARGHRFRLTSQVCSVLNRLDRLSAAGLLDARSEGRPGHRALLMTQK